MAQTLQSDKTSEKNIQTITGDITEQFYEPDRNYKGADSRQSGCRNYLKALEQGKHQGSRRGNQDIHGIFGTAYDTAETEFSASGNPLQQSLRGADP